MYQVITVFFSVSRVNSCPLKRLRAEQNRMSVARVHNQRLIGINFIKIRLCLIKETGINEIFAVVQNISVCTGKFFSLFSVADIRKYAVFNQYCLRFRIFLVILNAIILSQKRCSVPIKQLFFRFLFVVNVELV